MMTTDATGMVTFDDGSTLQFSSARAAVAFIAAHILDTMVDAPVTSIPCTDDDATVTGADA